MINFVKLKDKIYGPCDNCQKEGFHQYYIESDPPKVLGYGYWDEIVCTGFSLCDECAKKLRLEINSLVWG